MKKLILLLTLLAFTVSCGGTKKVVKKRGKKRVKISTGMKPDWVDGKSSKYPNAFYITAVGHAKKRNNAEIDAAGNMSQIFSVKIKGSEESMRKAAVKSKNGKLLEKTFENTFETRFKVDTEATFKGMFLSEYWKDENGYVYVLATIKRSQVLPALKESIADLDKIIVQYVDDAKNSKNDKAKALSYIKTALDKARLQESYNVQHSILDIQGLRMKTSYSVESLLAMVDRGMKNLKVAIVVSGEGGTYFRNLMLQTATNFGLEIDKELKEQLNNGSLDGDFESFGEDENSNKKNYGSDADLVIEGTISFKTLDKGDKYKWVTASLTIKLKNNVTNKVYKSVTINHREGHRTYQAAKRRAIIKLNKKIETALNKLLKKALGG